MAIAQGTAIAVRTAQAAWPIFEAALLGASWWPSGRWRSGSRSQSDWSFRAGQFVDITLSTRPRPTPRAILVASPSRARPVKA